MKTEFGVIVIVCVATVFVMHFLLDRTSFKVKQQILDVMIPIALNVPKLCQKICDRSNGSCFDPHSTILVYESSVLPDRMTFRQQFSPFVTKMNLSSVIRNAKLGKFNNRIFCSLEEIDPVLRTVEKGRKCAIVGNGGIVLGGGCGEEIDANDLVIRANFAGLESFERDVGRKTTIMMINDATLTNMYDTLVAKKRGDAGVKKMMKYITNHLNDSTIWFAKSTEAHNSASRLQKLAAFFHENRLGAHLGYSLMHVSQAVRSRSWKIKGYPSAGIDILAVAESLCKNITLYGFYPYDKDPNGKPLLHHYYEPNLTDFHTKVHNFNREHQMLRSLHEKGLLRLVYDPCVPDPKSVQV